jgi:hypothetical protein
MLGIDVLLTSVRWRDALQPPWVQAVTPGACPQSMIKQKGITHACVFGIDLWLL